MNEIDLITEQLIGRRLTRKELEKVMKRSIDIETLAVCTHVYPALTSRTCQRCGSCSNQWVRKPCLTCNESCYYCTQCLQFSRLSSCTKLYTLTAEQTTSYLQMMWHSYHHFSYKLPFELSESQNRVSQAIETAIVKREDLLVWAVTGAGKTEMTFRGIKTALNKQWLVCYAAPRVDVTIDLKPRYETAFSSLEVPIFYGGSEPQNRIAPFVMMTTHQLLRFYQIFDVIIIDEGDAFPFVNNSALHYAVNNALKPNGVVIWLTATPPKQLMDRVNKGNCQISILPARYHGHPLAVPQLKRIGNWMKLMDKKRCPKQLKQLITFYLEKGIPFLLFLPHIERMLQLEGILKRLYPKATFTSVSSQDKFRQEKVQKMREGYWDFLLTTTILERGVTFSGIDVIVFGSDHHTFTSEILIQIAGRVGRSVDHPTGKVTFLYHGQSRAMKSARNQIIKMNQLAQRAQNKSKEESEWNV